MLPFLSPQVESLEVELTGTSQSVNDFFSALAGRVPILKSFTLKTNIEALAIEGSFQRAIRTWKNLATLKIPPYYLRPSILEAAASLQNLVALVQDYWHYPPYDLSTTLQELPKDAFPKLKTFGFDGTPASAKQLVQRCTHLFTRITNMHLNAADGISDAEVLEFVRHLGATCRNAIHVSLDLSMDPTLQRADMAPLSVGVLEALFPCRDLGALELGHPFPLTINQNDVERMAAAWPRLNALNICSESHHQLPIPGDMGNSLSILQAFAKHYPMIQELGFFLAKDDALTFSGDLYPEFEFHRLEKIVVGTSAVPGGRLQDAGFLIASSCKLEPEIDIGPSVWYDWMRYPEWDEYQRQWEETAKNLEFAMRIKRAGRASR